MAAPFDTILLDVSAWDLTTDSQGNIALATAPYSVAQDMSSQCRQWRGEFIYQSGRWRSASDHPRRIAITGPHQERLRAGGRTGSGDERRRLLHHVGQGPERGWAGPGGGHAGHRNHHGGGTAIGLELAVGWTYFRTVETSFRGQRRWSALLYFHCHRITQHNDVYAFWLNEVIRDRLWLSLETAVRLHWKTPLDCSPETWPEPTRMAISSAELALRRSAGHPAPRIVPAIG